MEALRSVRGEDGDENGDATAGGRARRILSAAVWPLALIAGGLMTGCEADSPVSDDSVDSTIQVSGQGTVVAEPDMAQSQIGVRTFAETVDSAVAASNAATAAVIEALQSAGVERRDLQTSSFSLNPQRNYEIQPPPVVGFWVDNTVSIRIRDLPSAGSVLQAAIEAGANTVNGLFFTVENVDSLRTEARVLAVENARAKAETLAHAAGIEIGRVMAIREMSGTFPVLLRAEFDDAAATAVPLEGGELEVTAQVEVVFEIH